MTDISISLAQVGLPGLDLPEPPALPEPNLIPYLLFEQPIPGVLVLLALAGVCWSVFTTRDNRPMAAKTAGSAVLLAVALGVVSFAVETAREKVLRKTNELVRAVVRADAGFVRGALAEDAILVYFISPNGIGKEEIVEAVGSGFAQGGKYAVKEYGILERRAAATKFGTATVHMRLRVTPAATEAPVFSWWRIDYRNEPDGAWRVTGLAPLSISGVPNATGR